MSDVLLLPALTENVVFAIRKATHSGRRHPPRQPAAAVRQDHHRVLAEGRNGQDGHRDEPRAACAKFEGRKTLLLDLDLQFGDAAIMLGVEPEKTIYDLVVAPGELDREKLAGYITKHASDLGSCPRRFAPRTRSS